MCDITMKMTKRLHHTLVIGMIVCASRAYAQSPSPSVEAPTSRTQQLQAQMQELVGKLGKQVQDLKEVTPSAEEVQQMTQEEVNKIDAWEYLVKDFEDSIPLDKYQQELTVLGQERWDCYSIITLPKILRLTCRRRPKTYLRLIPRWVP